MSEKHIKTKIDPMSYSIAEGQYAYRIVFNKPVPFLFTHDQTIAAVVDHVGIPQFCKVVNKFDLEKFLEEPPIQRFRREESALCRKARIMSETQKS